MKSFLLFLGIFSSPLALANNKCIEEAKFEARNFSAQENEIDINTVQVSDSFYDSETNGVLYYGVLVEPYEQVYEKVNVGVKSSDCSLVEIDYVTAGGLQAQQFAGVVQTGLGDFLS